jgi:hypothetical protein
VPTTHQTLRHIRAHPAETDHCNFHDSSTVFARTHGC